MLGWGLEAMPILGASAPSPVQVMLQGVVVSGVWTTAMPSSVCVMACAVNAVRSATGAAHEPHWGHLGAESTMRCVRCVGVVFWGRG